ncbi:hypothetical protein Dsui_2607 [Azospira oryzae PS]|uniref:Uncharacterized protein n=1 Tax=Azospira oryzae (strain ATCC BAA-33 / DSM 13638 / PS) TaxID=640081 RepID=G8QNR4_AZOOP|nr:hypothetical protein [Azospira oryzae]AEV26958.1 hypothetical protein Dsui_2607 [Azospira oryzae PS]
MTEKLQDEFLMTLLMMLALFTLDCYVASFFYPHDKVMLVAGIGVSIIAVLLAYVSMFVNVTDGDGGAETSNHP